MLHNIISPNQAGFVKGRSITDNAMMGLDIMHHIYSKYNMNMALKFDMAKAFDKVNWCYLENMLRKFAFSEDTIQIIMKCVSTTIITCQV